MIRTQVYIPEKLYEAAKMCAQMKGENISVLMREGLTLAIQNTQQNISQNPLAELVGKYNAKDRDGTAWKNHNDIYK